MSRYGFRFVHATCLCLDEHLVGTGPLSADDRTLAEDATFRAWDGIVDTCIKTQAEFLILSGNSFNAKTNSLRARVALEKGFEKLAAHNISAFVVPGPLDPVSAWKRGLHLPPNVTLLCEEDHEPVAVMSDQKVLASLFVVATAQSDESRWSAGGPAAFQRHQAPFRIGLVGAGTPIRWEASHPVPMEHHDGASAATTLLKTALDHKTNYIALGEGIPFTEYHKSGLIHDPGCAQSLTAQVRGSRGCSVVNVDPSGEISIDPVAVAPIRWEEFSLHLEAPTNPGDLIEKMVLILMEQIPDPDERLWIIHWRFSGEGPLFESLAQPSSQADFWKKLEAEMTGEHAVRRLHRLERGVRPAPATQTTSFTQSTQGLLHDFQILLNESPSELIEEVRREMLELSWMKEPDARPLREAVQHLSRSSLVRQALSAAGRWLE